MLRWVLLFLGISVVAWALGFTELSAATAQIARIICIIFLAMFVIGLVLVLLGR